MTKGVLENYAYSGALGQIEEDSGLLKSYFPMNFMTLFALWVIVLSGDDLRLN